MVLFYVHGLCFQTRKYDAWYVTFLGPQREKFRFRKIADKLEVSSNIGLGSIDSKKN